MSTLSVMREFYDFAARCRQIQREDNRMTCKRTNEYCAPRTCPVAGVWNRFQPQVEKQPKKPVEKPKIKKPVLIERPEKPKIPVLQIEKSERPKPTFKIKKKLPYTPHRPSVKKGKVRRCLVTFHDKRGELSRWGYTAVLTSARKKTPFIREYPGNICRFYFPEDAEELQITSYVGSWFLAQHLHDENKPVNQAGSPELIRVELF